MDSGHQTVATNQLADDPIYQVLSVSVSRHPHSLSSCCPVFFTLYNYVTCSPQQLLTCQNKYLQLVKSNIQNWGLVSFEYGIWIWATPHASVLFRRTLAMKYYPELQLWVLLHWLQLKTHFGTSQTNHWILYWMFHLPAEGREGNSIVHKSRLVENCQDARWFGPQQKVPSCRFQR